MKHQWNTVVKITQDFNLSCSSTLQVLLLQRSSMFYQSILCWHSLSVKIDTKILAFVETEILKIMYIPFHFMFVVPETVTIWTSPLNSHLGLVIIASSCSLPAPCQKLLFPLCTTIIIYLISIETRSVPRRTICLSTACGTERTLNFAT